MEKPVSIVAFVKSNRVSAASRRTRTVIGGGYNWTDYKMDGQSENDLRSLGLESAGETSKYTEGNGRNAAKNLKCAEKNEI